MYSNMWFQLLICLWSLLLFLLTLQPSAGVKTFFLRGLPLTVSPFCRSAPDWGNDTRVNSLLMKGIAAEQMVQQDCKQSFPPKEWILAVNVSPCSEEVISYITTSMSWNLHLCSTIDFHLLQRPLHTPSLMWGVCFQLLDFFLIKNNGYWPFFSVTYNCFYGDALFLSLTSEREPQLKPANIWPVGAENGTIYEAAKSNAPAAGRRMPSQALTQLPPEKREDECFWKKHSHTPS